MVVEYITLLIATVVLVVTTVGFQWLMNRVERLKLLKSYGIPGPVPKFLSGNMKQLKSEPTPNGIITSWLKEYGNVFGYYIGGMPYIVVNDQEMLHQVFEDSGTSSKFINRQDMFLDVSPLNKTLLALKDQRWREVRQTVSHAFTPLNIKKMSDILNKKIDITLKVIEEKAQNNEMFDMYELMQGLTLDVIADCALAMKTHCQENPQDIFLIAVRDFFRNAHNRAVEYAIMFPFIASIMAFISNYMTAGQMTNLIVDNLKTVISARRKNKDIKSLDLLQVMLDKAEDEKKVTGLTDEEIVANAYIFILAGYETTATALAFTFYLLIKHTDVQEKLYEEVKDLEANHDTVLKLPYLDQVFNESLRLLTPVTGFVSRECSEDTQIGSYTIPKGVIVLAPVWDIHHDPDLWSDPWKFDPDRFAPENNPHKINSTAFLPFGIGRRHCIGQRFAQQEAKLALFRLVKSFRFEACEKTDMNCELICPTVIINPVNGVFLRAVPRTPSS